MTKTKWKLLVGFKNIPDGRYKISTHGDVRTANSKPLLPKKIANKKYHPYYAVYLHNNLGKGEWILVHQLVAHCFCPIPDKYSDKVVYKDLVPDHIDNDGLNNYYKNLEWKTRGENISKAFNNKEINTSCDKHNGALITNQQAMMICEYLEENISYDDILDRMGLPNTKTYRTLLVRIKNRIAWKEISTNYNFKSDKIKYTAKQQETIVRIPDILRLSKLGYTSTEIARMLWSNLSDKRLQIKSRTVSLVRRGLIFKEILQGSSTKESVVLEETSSAISE